MSDKYIGLGYFVEGDGACITLTRIEDTDHSIPDKETKNSERIPTILTWINNPQVVMPWPLGFGIMTIGEYNFNLDLLPKIEAECCYISLNDSMLIIHFPKCKVLLAARTPGDSPTPNLLEHHG